MKTRNVVFGIVITLMIVTSGIAIFKVCGLNIVTTDNNREVVECLLGKDLFDSNTVTYLITLIAVLLVSMGVAAITSEEKQFKEFQKDANTNTANFLSKMGSIDKRVSKNKELIEKLNKKQNTLLRNAIHETIIIEYINIIYIILILPDLSSERIPHRLLIYNYQIGRFVDRIDGYMTENSVQSFECKMQKKALELISEIIENFKTLNKLNIEHRNSEMLNRLVDLRKRIKNLKSVEMNS